MKKLPLTLIILSANSQDVIANTLKSFPNASELVLVTNATDNTIKIAKSYYPKLKLASSPIPFNFATARNIGLKSATQDWVLYLDVDEIVTPELNQEIENILNSNDTFVAYDLPRANYFLNHRVRHGGTYPDYVKRLYKKSALIGYQGALHEQPQINGPSSTLKSDLLHFTHTDLHSMLAKSIDWTQMQVPLYVESNHPPVVWWRFIRVMLTKYWQRFILQSMWCDRSVGIISTIFEMFDTFMIYAYLYEFQIQKDAKSSNL